MADQLDLYDIVPTSLAVKAMRDNGYKNAAYAVAELMDNSIQAGASLVQLLCADRKTIVNQRVRQSIDRIAVLDDGVGMDAKTLRIALQFGNGSRLTEDEWDGMGRFGMGLPSASISQCKRVDVWSWQNGPESALHSYIDLAEIEEGTLRNLPEPEAMEVPAFWKSAAEDKALSATGTLVVWSKIDRSLWRTSSALINHSERLIGRMYRKWINEEKVRIRLVRFMEDAPGTVDEETDAVANDPLYLMPDTSCPKPPPPFEGEMMFQPFPDADSYEHRMTIGFNGKEHEVVTRFAIAKEEAREQENAGNLPHGKHAKQNVGVSIVRAGRELDMDQGWTIAYDPRERWWGVEVCFDPGLDELFGVANNKQSARNFSEAAKLDFKALAKDYDGSISAARAALEEDENPIAPMIEVITRIQSNIEQMRQQIKTQGTRRKRRRHNESTTEQQATERLKERQRGGHQGQSDIDEELPRDERENAIAESLVDQGHTPEEAHSLAAETIDKGLRYRMEPGPIEGGSFFSVQQRGGVLLVTLNSDHPAYELLLGAQDPQSLPENTEALREKLFSAQSGLEMMLFAWARYEDEQMDPQLRRRAQNVRHDWGRMAENFLEAQADDTDG